MQLRYAQASPFARKVRISAALLGLESRIELVPADTRNADDPLRVQNPLGKVPTLITDDGTTLFDSRVIIEYLDALAGGGRIIPAGSERWPALRLQALADGIADAVVLQVYEERFRPAELRSADWVAYQAGKVDRALTALEAAPPTAEATIHVGHVALACALGYGDFRQAGAWRKGRPKLVRWFDGFSAKVPALAATAPK